MRCGGCSRGCRSNIAAPSTLGQEPAAAQAPVCQAAAVAVGGRLLVVLRGLPAAAAQPGCGRPDLAEQGRLAGGQPGMLRCWAMLPGGQARGERGSELGEGQLSRGLVK